MKKHGQVKLSSFLIAMIVVSMFVSVFFIMLSSLSSQYGTAYDNESIEVYSKFDEIYNQTQAIEEKTQAIKQKSGFFDILGGLLSDAYDALKLSYNSYDVFYTLADQASQDSNTGQASGIFLKAIGAIVMILLLFVLIRALVKVDV